MAQLCKSIARLLSEAYTQPYSFGGGIKLIICQIRLELSVTIHEIYGGPYGSRKPTMLLNVSILFVSMEFFKNFYSLRHRFKC